MKAQAAHTTATTDDQISRRFASELRTNYIGLAPSSLGFAFATLLAVVTVFWNQTSQTGLMVWSTVQFTLMIAGFLVARVSSPKQFMNVAIINEVVQAAWWATLPILALPTSPDWQTLQGLVLVALLLATLGNATASRRLHIASTIPLGLITAVVFTFGADGAAQWMAVAVAVTLPFTLFAGSMLREVQTDLFTSSLRNENLASTLRHDGDQLKVVNEQLEEANTHLAEQSRIDPLTGLCNRTGFTSILNDGVVARPEHLAVCYLDLDKFKRINDAFGHRFGDLVLQDAARRISEILTPNEVLARQGGDEFTLLGFVENMDEVRALGGRILSAFEEPFLIEGRRLEISVSAGLVWQREATTADDLMRFADTALYEAKGNGRGRFEIFDDAMRAELDSRTLLQADLGAAFDRAEIAPYLQPIVNIDTGQISAAEALARWKHPDGVRAATEFIDTARDLGMLDRINDTVAAHVFDFQRKMHASGRTPCPITVNASPIHLEAMLNRVIAEKDIAPIVIEVTEDGIFSDLDGARRLLTRARAADIQVYLDDFGVGFSSLSIATELPIDGFKIDRGFVASLAGNPSAVAAVEAIIQLAQRMELNVVAEGVETEEQLRLLRGLGVQFAQGFLFSEAVPMDTFATWLHTGHRFDVLHESMAEKNCSASPHDQAVGSTQRG